MRCFIREWAKNDELRTAVTGQIFPNNYEEKCVCLPKTTTFSKLSQNHPKLYPNNYCLLFVLNVVLQNHFFVFCFYFSFRLSIYVSFNICCRIKFVFPRCCILHKLSSKLLCSQKNRKTSGFNIGPKS